MEREGGREEEKAMERGRRERRVGGRERGGREGKEEGGIEREGGREDEVEGEGVGGGQGRRGSTAKKVEFHYIVFCS